MHRGAARETRTPKAFGHYHLKVACLPIPPSPQIANAIRLINHLSNFDKYGRAKKNRPIWS